MLIYPTLVTLALTAIVPKGNKRQVHIIQSHTHVIYM